MTVAIKDFTISRNGQTTRVRRFSETGGANAQLAMSCAPGVPARLIWAANKMSDAGTDAVTIKIDSGVSSAFDVFFPSFNSDTGHAPAHDFVIAEDDAVIFTIAAGGSGVTAHCQAYFELLEG